MSFLDTSNASKQGDVKESLETILTSLREVAAQRETEAGGERISELKQLLEHVGETISLSFTDFLTLGGEVGFE